MMNDPVRGLRTNSTMDSVRSHASMRNQVLMDVATCVCTPEQAIRQKSSGVWRWSAGVIFPSIEDVVVTDDGCLMLPFMSVPRATMSVWVQPGEVRVGIIMPSAMLPMKSDLKELFVRAFDGQPCTRVTRNGDTAMLDWIFRDDFADFDFYCRMLHNPTLSAFFVERLSGVIVHLYMAFTNHLYDADSAGQNFQFDALATETREIEITGDIEAFKSWIHGRSAIVSLRELAHARGRERPAYSVTIRTPKSFHLAAGAYESKGSAFVVTHADVTAA